MFIKFTFKLRPKEFLKFCPRNLIPLTTYFRFLELLTVKLGIVHHPMLLLHLLRLMYGMHGLFNTWKVLANVLQLENLQSAEG